MDGAMNRLEGHALDHITKVLGGHIPDTAPSRNAGRNAAVAMVLSERPENPGLSALFIQRAEHPNDPWSGQMALPGGRHEPFDASLDAAARRETLEEVGLELAEGMQIGRLNDLAGGRLSNHRLAVSSFVYHHPDPPALTPNYEVAETVWVPLEFLGDPRNVSPYVFDRDPSQREFPSWNYEGYTIWGLTYRIIASYLQLFGLELPGEPGVTDVE